MFFFSPPPHLTAASSVFCTLTPCPHRVRCSTAQRNKWKILHYLHSAAQWYCCCTMCEHSPWQQLFPFFALHHTDVTLRYALCVGVTFGLGNPHPRLASHMCSHILIWNVLVLLQDLTVKQAALDAYSETIKVFQNQEALHEHHQNQVPPHEIQRSVSQARILIAHRDPKK